MRRLKFLVPAAVAGVVVAAIALALDLDALQTYVLVGVFGFVLLLSGAIQDLGIGIKHRVVVEMHEAAIGAEHAYRPKSGDVEFRVIHETDEQRLFANNPVRITARRARLQTLFFEKLDKRSVVTFSHWPDPTQKSRV